MHTECQDIFVNGLPRRVKITRFRSGLRQRENRSPSIAGIPIMWEQWPGRRMGNALPRGAMIRRCKCGKHHDVERRHAPWPASAADLYAGLAREILLSEHESRQCNCKFHSQATSTC